MNPAGPQPVLGNYVLEAPLGSGAMGAVYLARHQILGTAAAVKVIHSHLLSNTAAVDRFLREAKVAAGLRHPNIVRVFDFGKERDQVFLVMDYLPGRPLNTFIDGQPMPAAKGLPILRQIASAVDYLHGQRVVHRDLKPSNIIVDDAGTATLVDFGIARAIEGADMTAQNNIVGTPLYLPPETYSGGKAGPAGDAWALGVIAYEMFTGRTPYQARTLYEIFAAVMNEPITPPSGINRSLSPAVDMVLMKELSRQPEGRYPSAMQFVDALEAAAKQQGNPSTQPVNVSKTSVATPPPAIDTSGTPTVIRDVPPIAPSMYPPMPPPSMTPATPLPAAPVAGTGNAGKNRGVCFAISAIGGLIVAVVLCTSGFFGTMGLYNVMQVLNATPTATPIPPATVTARALATAQARATSTAIAAATAAVQATATAVVDTEIGEAFALQSHATRIYGPVSGQLVHSSDNTVSVEGAGVGLSDFAAQAVFFNPAGFGDNAWDYGFMFRHTGINAQYRLVLSSVHDTSVTTKLDLRLYNGNLQNPVTPKCRRFSPSSGTLWDVPDELFDRSEGGSNRLRVVVKQNKIWVFVNEALQGVCDLSNKLEAGDVRVGTGFYLGNALPGATTKFTEFTVWQLAD